MYTTSNYVVKGLPATAIQLLAPSRVWLTSPFCDKITDGLAWDPFTFQHLLNEYIGAFAVLSLCQLESTMSIIRNLLGIHYRCSAESDSNENPRRLEEMDPPSFGPDKRVPEGLIHVLTSRSKRLKNPSSPATILYIACRMVCFRWSVIGDCTFRFRSQLGAASSVNLVQRIIAM